MVNNLSGYVNFKGNITAASTNAANKTKVPSANEQQNVQPKQAYSAENVRAYGTTRINNALNTEETQQKYSEVSKLLEPETRVKLSNLLKTGTLLNNNSNDGSSVLDNLHKIATEPRIRGLSAKNLLTEAIETVSNPSIITQKFGDIPESFNKAIYRHPDLGVRSAEQMDIGDNSNCCVAASIEYDLASTNPAEFVRMAAGLSSEDYSVTKNLSLSDIADTKEDAMWLLEKFNLPHQVDENDNVQVKIQPDRSAIIRARVQTSYRDEGERSSLDVLMQSAFMNVGSAQTYDALTDTRKANGDISSETKGLSYLEATFTGDIIGNTPKDTILCMGIDETDYKLMPFLSDYDRNGAADNIRQKLQTVNPEDIKNADINQTYGLMSAISKSAIEDLTKASVTPEFEEQINQLLYQQSMITLTEKEPNISQLSEEDALNSLKANMPEIMQETVRKSVRAVAQEIVGNTIIQALQKGQNVMVGYYPYIDEVNDSYIDGGHEINVVDVAEGPQGETIFVCKDTMNDDEPINVSAEFLLPRLHHANLPKELIDHEHLVTVLDSMQYLRQNT